MTFSSRMATISLIAGLMVMMLPAWSLAVTGEEFIDEVVVRLGQSTSAYVNLWVLFAAILFVFALYIAVKISESRQHRDVERYLRRFQAYHEKVMAARSVRRSKIKAGARRK